MTTTLYIGDYAYSSWSLRGWLLFHAFGIPVVTKMVSFSADEDVSARMMEMASPARTVPTARFEDGAVAWDSLSIAEEVASRHPEARLWPDEPDLRTMARALAAEMHAGFSTLRSFCPMNLRLSYTDVPISEELHADLNRLDALWAHALDRSGGPWLCGEYSIADAFYAPVAGRIAGFSLPVAKRSLDYVNQHLHHGPFRRWRALGLVNGETLPWYAKDYPTRDWPGPKPAAAKPVDAGPSINSICPYSGKDPAHYLEYDGRIWGFCNPGCRDKTVADPEAWPAFMEMVANS